MSFRAGHRLPHLLPDAGGLGARLSCQLPLMHGMIPVDPSQISVHSPPTAAAGLLLSRPSSVQVPRSRRSAQVERAQEPSRSEQLISVAVLRGDSPTGARSDEQEMSEVQEPATKSSPSPFRVPTEGLAFRLFRL